MGSCTEPGSKVLVVSTDEEFVVDCASFSAEGDLGASVFLESMGDRALEDGEGLLHAVLVVGSTVDWAQGSVVDWTPGSAADSTPDSRWGSVVNWIQGSTVGSLPGSGLLVCLHLTSKPEDRPAEACSLH